MPSNHRDDHALSADQERAVRDLLASARHDEPIPHDVAARLEANLAELSAVRRELRVHGEAGAPVVSLAARRRRRVTTGLLAAAATVVLGVGLGQVLPSAVTPTGGDAASTESGSDLGSGREAAPELGTTDSRRDDLRPTNEPGARAEKAPLPPPRVDPEAFRRSVREIRDRSSRVRAHSGYLVQDRALGTGAPCAHEPAGPGRQVLVDYGGTLATLLIGRASGGVQPVELLACDSGELLRSARLTVR